MHYPANQQTPTVVTAHAVSGRDKQGQTTRKLSAGQGAGVTIGRRTVMIYSFLCPFPCNRKIEVDAKDHPDAIDKMLRAGAMRCRNGENRRICERATLALNPMPEEQLKCLVGLCLQEEEDRTVTSC